MANQVTFGVKQSSGIFAPIMGLKRDFPVILIDNVFTPDNENVLLKDGKIIRRKMREKDLLDSNGNKVQTPDGNPIIHYHRIVKRATGIEYLLAFTRAHIYHWNPSTKAFNTKWTNHNINAITIAFNDNGASPDTITDSGNGFLTAGFVVGDKITVSGSTSNDGDYTIAEIVAGTITLVSTDELTTEVAGDSVTIVANCENWETVNYNDKVIATNFLDKVLVWTTAGNFVALDDTTNGIEYSRSYSNETNVDETSAKDQKVLKVASTTGYLANDKIIIDRNTKYREEIGVVDSVQAGVSLTLKENLIYEHTADALTTVDADSESGQKVLNVASTVGFEEMELVTINKGGDREEIRRIDTIQSGVSLTMTVNLSFTHTQVQGDEVLGSGGQNDKVEEYVSYYLTKAKHLTTYESYLILGYTYENGSYYPQRKRWNAIGEEENWVTGTSGSTEVGSADKITGFGNYQGLLIVFKEYSYYKYWLVATDLIFNGTSISTKIGCRCSGSIVNDSKGRLYWYASDGTFKEFSVGTISGPIQTDIVDKIYQSSVEKIKSDFIDETEEVFWSIPVDNALNNKVISFKEGKWLQLNLSIPAFGNYHEA